MSTACTINVSVDVEPSPINVTAELGVQVIAAGVVVLDLDEIRDLDPLIVTDSALLNSANVGRPLPQRTVRTFNGTTQYASKAVSNYRSGDASGAIEATFNTTSVLTRTIFSTADESTDDDSFSCVIRDTGQVQIGVKISGVSDVIVTDAAFNDGLTHTARFTSNGMSWSIEVDGVAQSTSVLAGTNTGAWFSSVSGRDNLVIGALKRTTVISHFDGTISDIKVYDPSGTVVNQWDIVENGGSVMRDALGVHDLTYINNPVATTDSTFIGSDPLNERGFTEGTGSNGAAIGEYLVARLDFPCMDVGGNATQWANTAYPVLPNITGGTAEVFTALNTNVADDGDQTPAIRLAGLPATWTQGDPNIPRFQVRDNGDSTSSFALGLPDDPTPTEQISIDKYHDYRV